MSRSASLELNIHRMTSQIVCLWVSVSQVGFVLFRLISFVDSNPLIVAGPQNSQPSAIPRLAKAPS